MAMSSAIKYPLLVGENKHTILKLPSKISEELSKDSGVNPKNILNILMADVSGSMSCFWDDLEKGWNNLVSPALQSNGRCRLYAYGDFVELLREDCTELKSQDFRSTGTEDLTNALKTVMKEINTCKETYIRAFIVSDGAHCVPGEQPDNVIKTMKPPLGKTVEVYMLGVGMSFPVQYSIDIRSLLHNGSTSIPYIFWPQRAENIEEQMSLIAHEIKGGSIQMNLTIPGSYIPGIETTDTVHLDEWIYYDKSPEELQDLKISLENGNEISITNSEHMPYDLMTKGLFSQWNKVILQRHRKKESFDKKIFDIMESHFKYELEKLKVVDLSNATQLTKRLHEKSVKKFETDFSTLMNQSKSLIDVEDKYRNEIDLAEILVRTTAVGKYEHKSLRLKGHSSEDYTKDLEQFIEIYQKIKDKIMEITPPDFDDCCRITVSSTITDLQDSAFEELFKENKFEFLKTFTLTGIPILTILKDSTELNPWTIHIKNILINPFEVLSQRALEFGADAGDLKEKDKSVVLKQSDEKTRFNAVIPVFPKGTVDILKPLLTTNVFSMCCTFAILKNVLIIDYECHIAALACVWMKTIHDYAKTKRPEFICKRIEYIEETSKIYIGRKGLKNYSKCLMTDPKKALTTECEEEFEGSKIKCESIIKPAFLLHIYQDILKPSADDKIAILKVTLTEFVGRCFTHNNSKTPFTDVYLQDVKDEKEKNEWYENVSKDIIQKYDKTGDNLLNEFYTPEQMIKSTKIDLRIVLSGTLSDYFQSLKIEINMDKIKKLSNSGSCGDVSWDMLKSWANELGIVEDTINECFSSDMAMTYVCHALKNKSSKSRMTHDLPSVANAREIILKEIKKENSKEVSKFLMNKIPSIYKERWLKSYNAAHELLVSPMTKTEIIKVAKTHNIDVTESNFDEIYRFRPGVNLLRNACMSTKCPHFLQPHNNYNQHISIERQRNSYPHNVHLITSANYKTEVASIIQLVSKEKPKRPRKTPKVDSSDQYHFNLEHFLPKLISEYQVLNSA